LKFIKRLILLFIFFAVLIGSAPFLIARYVDLNAYRPQLAAMASKALDAQVILDGPLSFTVFPTLGLVLSKPRIIKDGRQVVALKKVRLDLAIKPLFDRVLQFERINLISPQISLTSESKLGLVTSGIGHGSETSIPYGFRIKIADSGDVSIQNADISFSRANWRQPLRFVDAQFHLHSSELKSIGRHDGSSVSASGKLSIRSLQTPYTSINKIKSSVIKSGPVVRFNNLSANLFEGHGQGQLIVDQSKTIAKMDFQFELEGFDIARLLETVSEQAVMSGPARASVNLHWEGMTLQNMLATLGGETLVNGEGITLHGVNVDKLLDRIKKVQRINLVDLGAFMFMGPWGTAMVKGRELSNVAKATSGATGTLDQFVSRWSIKDGIARAEDVAFTTIKNRVALRGRINLVSRYIDGMTVAVLNKKGCATFSQKIHGALDNPTIEKPSFFKAITAPVSGALTAPLKLLSGKRCNVFYAGSLAHPG